jgi:hypothetical protein
MERAQKLIDLRKENPILQPPCRSGGIGRRAGLKIQWPQGRVGSSPTFGTLHSILGEDKLSL